MQYAIAAVLTGDVNASSKIQEKDARRLENLLSLCFQDLDHSLQHVGAGGFTNFRGDSWQFVIGEPEHAVRAALFYRCSLLVRSKEELGKRLHTSASIGFGSITYLPSDVSRAGGGKAYEASGKRLDKLRRRVPGMGEAGLGEIDPFLDCLLGVVDALVRGWTARQAQAVSYALQGLSQIEIAGKWKPPVSQQAVHKHLLSAGWPAIDPALRWAETTIKDCITENNLKAPTRGDVHAR